LIEKLYQTSEILLGATTDEKQRRLHERFRPSKAFSRAVCGGHEIEGKKEQGSEGSALQLSTPDR
jgi:hypothetical protein